MNFSGNTKFRLGGALKHRFGAKYWVLAGRRSFRVHPRVPTCSRANSRCGGPGGYAGIAGRNPREPAGSRCGAGPDAGRKQKRAPDSGPAEIRFHTPGTAGTACGNRFWHSRVRRAGGFECIPGSAADDLRSVFPHVCFHVASFIEWKSYNSCQLNRIYMEFGVACNSGCNSTDSSPTFDAPPDEPA
jgi:hypothetical protein